VKLDRNINGNGRGKYALIKNRMVDQIMATGGDYTKLKLHDALALLKQLGVLDDGSTPETEFFVIRLKDENAEQALREYANKAAETDNEYADEVMALSRRSGPYHPNCKKPD